MIIGSTTDAWRRELLSRGAREGCSEEEFFDVGMKGRMGFARGRSGVGQRWSNCTNSHERPCCVVGRNAGGGGGTWEQLRKEASEEARGRCSMLIFPHLFLTVRLTLIKPVVNGLKAEMSGVRRKPKPEP